MILREWRGRAAPDNRDGYPDHFRRSVAPELKSLAGFLGAQLFRQDRGSAIEYLVLTRWASMDAIRVFAGDDIGKAVVEPGAVAALVEFDDRVQHYELLDEIGSSD